MGCVGWSVGFLLSVEGITTYYFYGVFDQAWPVHSGVDPIDHGAVGTFRVHGRKMSLGYQLTS